MKISVNDQVIFELNDTQKKVIMNEIPEEIFDADMKRRLEWVLMHKYEQCYKELKSQWEPKLAARGVEAIPTNKDAFAELIFAQEDYKNRSAREVEVAAVRN